MLEAGLRLVRAIPGAAVLKSCLAEPKTARQKRGQVSVSSPWQGLPGMLHLTKPYSSERSGNRPSSPTRRSGPGLPCGDQTEEMLPPCGRWKSFPAT